MIEEWRIALYPLGLLSSFIYGVRFFVQWIASERKKRSYTPKLFWHLSLLGNLLLCVHSLVQVQYPICMTQTINAVISWRNLNLLNESSKRKSFYFVLFLLILSFLFITFLFLIQGVLNGEMIWNRQAIYPGASSKETQIPFAFHIIGWLGIFLFCLRFWIQWWYAEKSQSSELNSSFWWLSLTGALMSLFYFSLLQDIVNILGPSFGLIPYVRNIILVYKTRKSALNL